MKKKCYLGDSQSKDTAGQPIKILVCYCGTTACTQGLQGLQYDYPLPSDFKRLRDCELTKEEEDKFYKKVFSR